MELRHLRYFAAIAEARSFSRAAAHLHIAQSALSQRIQDLEAELECELVERQSRGIQLTPAGSYYLDEVKQLLARLDAAGEQARQIQRGELGSLRLAILESFSNSGPIHRLLRQLRHTLPGLNLRLLGMHSTPQPQALLERSIDAGFILRQGELPPELDRFPMIELPVQLMVPSGHPLATRTQVSLQEQAELDFIWPPPHNAYAVIFQNALQDITWRPHVVQEANSYTTMMHLVAAGLGCAWGPSQATSLMDGIVQIPIQDFPLRIHIDLVWRRDNPSPALKRFLQLAREQTGEPLH